MEYQIMNGNDCDCHGQRRGFVDKYRAFLLTRDSILTGINLVTLVAALVVSIAGYYDSVGRWIYLFSALVGGFPLFIFTLRQVFIIKDFTAGVMASIAIIAALIVGEYEAAALVVLMMSLGEWLEKFTVARAGNALKNLSSIVPSSVTIQVNGKESLIPLGQLRIGDMLLVRSGERIGADGIVLKGIASINQAAITGESMPDEKKAGDQVYAGSLNETGALEIEVQHLGNETALGKIIRLVTDAQASQAPVQRVANRYARILVPATIVIAVFTYLLTGDVLRSITILVAVCPCALVLATPTAVVAAIGNAARKGMLIKNGGVMEEIGKVDVVAFDKTGTLTLGKPKVHQIIPLNGFDPDILLQLAASAERYSEHPIGRSMVAESERRSLSLYDPEDFHVLPGFGISARVQDDLVVIGNQTHLREKNVDWPEEIAIQIDQLEANGQTVVAVAANGRLAGLITLVDAPRENLRQVIQDLKDLGIRQVTMITGDHERAAERVAGLLGIDHFHSRVLPEDKLHIVKEMQAGGYKVAYVGDGINDAPALAAADIGIAMGISGTDVALETADIGLMTDEIDRLPQVIDLSRKTIRVIRQNVIFSMGVNIVAVILAGFGIISPVIGAIVHEVSALPVLANSARLVDHRLPQASPGRSVFKTSSDKVVQH